MAANPFPYLILIARLCAGVLAGVGLAFYTLVLIKVLDYRFPGQDTFLTALPLIGASYSIAWNILALSTILLVAPIWHSIGDAIALAVLLSLGAVGLYHDSFTYLRNGMYLQYDNGSWFFQEVFGSVMLLLSAITQFIVMIMCIVKHKKSKRIVRAQEAEVLYPQDGFVQPADMRKSGEFMVDCKSVVSFESDVVSLAQPDSVKRGSGDRGSGYSV
ncbi:hypothetical protein GLAREA_05136 [Glarea lozoyensis ATCC 20868]|uniref:Uncharacterized protein n=1 Tax=Glarea lozoyensis (strain ATCC 20868 / MF5171) TaxID=1116229 RepID=S3EBY9_GLAL2|nr:uncharacterized protein GLAREA_05136 [Glarea lozoyensis ATCC 20868]EPE35798.1 hypothetical protein GLAREA_05136 [Glarea lozoyensis ATCC 20868]